MHQSRFNGRLFSQLCLYNSVYRTARNARGLKAASLSDLKTFGIELNLG